MNSLHFKNTTYENHLNDEERSLRKQEEKALINHNLEELERTLQRKKILENVRAGFREAMVNPRSFRVLEGGNRSDSVVAGAYQRGPQAGPKGLNSLDSLAGTDTSKESIADTLRHENGHAEAHTKALQRGVAGQVAAHFGEDVSLALDEAHAMSQEKKTDKLSNKTSEYRGYQATADKLCRETRSDLVQLFGEGKEDVIVEHLYQARMAA